MKKMFNEGNQIQNIISSSGSGTVINYDSGSDFSTSYGSGSTSQKVKVPTVSVPQHWGQACDDLSVLRIICGYLYILLVTEKSDESTQPREESACPGTGILRVLKLFYMFRPLRRVGGSLISDKLR
jgi:hypothetical protein